MRVSSPEAFDSHGHSLYGTTHVAPPGPGEPRMAFTLYSRPGFSNSMEFSQLGLSPKVLEAVTASGFTTPTAIQAEAIPHALARRDVLGLAQTGSGKTAAFVQHALLLAHLNPGLPGVIGAPTYRLLSDVTRSAFLEALAVNRIPHRFGKSDNEVFLHEPRSIVRFRSLDKPQGLVGARKAYVVATSGGEYGGTPVATMHAGYLKQTLRFIGVADVEVITAEGLALPQRRDAALARAQAQIASLQLEAA